jgi:hypothetical protein
MFGAEKFVPTDKEQYANTERIARDLGLVQ